MTPKENLKKARTILVEEGWRKADLGWDGHPKCLLGALWATNCTFRRSLDVGQVASVYPEETRLLAQASIEIYGTRVEKFFPSRQVYRTNDSLCETKADALHVIDAAIALAEGEESGGTIHGHPISEREFEKLTR